MLDRITPERGALYLMDRGYLDFARLYALHCQGAYFVMRAKYNLQARRRTRRGSQSGPRDQTVVCSVRWLASPHRSAAPIARSRHR